MRDAFTSRLPVNEIRHCEACTHFGEFARSGRSWHKAAPMLAGIRQESVQRSFWTRPSPAPGAPGHPNHQRSLRREEEARGGELVPRRGEVQSGGVGSCRVWPPGPIKAAPATNMSLLVTNCPRCRSKQIGFDLIAHTDLPLDYGWQRKFEASCVCSPLGKCWQI